MVLKVSVLILFLNRTKTDELPFALALKRVPRHKGMFSLIVSLIFWRGGVLGGLGERAHGKDKNPAFEST